VGQVQSYVERTPVPALRQLASQVWVQRIGEDAAPYAHRRIPNGAAELVCRVGSAPQVFGPKALHRMLRFQGFLALVQLAIAQGHARTGRGTDARRRAAADEGLGMLAVRAGYADQPHLTRECVRLTGVSPRVFLAETRQTCACGHRHRASFAPLLRAEHESGG
jgi:hypothetical protein